MPAQLVILPNGQTYTVTPVFGGYAFKSTTQDLHHSAMPPGWTVVLQTEDEVDNDDLKRRGKTDDDTATATAKTTVAHRFTQPTLQNDSLFISSISMPSSSNFKGPTSPTRYIALMLWSTLYWYFHKEAPNPHVKTGASARTPESGRPKGEWRIWIKREGIFKGKNNLPKLERMGLIATDDSSVGTDPDFRSLSGWSNTFVSQKSFWQLDAKLFLFTLAQVQSSPYPAQSPLASRPSSPDRSGDGGGTGGRTPQRPTELVYAQSISVDPLSAGLASPGGPFTSTSHLPTYYPPPPTQFTFTNHIRHPIRPKPPRQAEVFYTRYIPSLDSWLSFRVPSLSPKPVTINLPGPTSSGVTAAGQLGAASASASASASALSLASAGGTGTGSAPASIATLPTLSSFAERPSDTDLLHKWMNDPRVDAFWGEAGPKSHQAKFLETGLSDRHSFPVFGCFDGKPFAYFEIYWVKEDKLARLLGGDVGNYARGIHVLVGEQEFRGPHRVKVWLSSLVHYCFLADLRTETVILEPRVDNVKFIEYLKQCGFYKQGEVSFPHKQSAVMKIDRDSWTAPAI